jgi:hypothetical protein
VAAGVGFDCWAGCVAVVPPPLVPVVGAVDACDVAPVVGAVVDCDIDELAVGDAVGIVEPAMFGIMMLAPGTAAKPSVFPAVSV